MANNAPDNISSVLAPDFKKPFTLLVALCALLIVFFVGVSYVEGFVDGRVELKLASQKQATEDHEKRIGKIEEKLGSMAEVLSDIRADVKVMRAQMEKK